ncbi:gliding motility-associated C-terminal domain-containing protein [Tenacibaculum mesophilum]|uniref:gliding motility-associated C-terminal domain-containing protein n=1 Tax=Tenacibaculum mesophilum TaxID=104268 RepID=UPI00248FB209|nr:gliding motility-associated C-terminal domain-containing protein [Tenacibaculum mesophilum]
MKKITSFILFFIVVFLVAGGKLEAQIKKGFQSRFSEAVKGNVTLIANNVLSRNKTTSYIGSDGNHDFSNNVFVDIDSDASTFNSSSANLSNPEPTVSCLSIKKAYLYWAAADKEEDNSSDEPNWDYNKVKLQLPGSLGYTTITADDVIYRGRDEIGHFVNDPYICFKDITSEVKALATPYGTYQVANVRAKEGSLTSHGGGNTGTSGGWQIVFVYESPTLPAKNISLFDGYAHVTSSVNNFEIGFSGFQTVPTGDVDVDVVIGALEGDRDLSGDRLQIKNTSNNWVDLSYSLRSSSNFFNSRIAKNGSNFIDRNPASTNTLGFDADVFALSNPGNSIIANNQTSATIRLTSNQETYGLFLIGLSVDVWKPDLAPLILSNSTNTSSVEDTVSFSVNIENNGNDNVKDLTIETTIPQEVDLIEPIIGLPFGVTYSYNTTTRLLTFDAIDGITDVGDTPYSLSFQVKVKEQCYFLEEMCSDKFQMQLIATYAGEENNSTQTTLSSKSVDSCGIGDNLPNEISINQPDEANWTTTVDSLDRTVSCDDNDALTTAQSLTPEASCDLTITKMPGSFEASTTNCPVIGTYTNTWTFTDACGRTSGQFIQTITVTDTTAPTLSSEPADVSVDCESIPVVPTITATDNCDSTVDVTFTEVSNTVVDGCGEIVRQWESTDNCGNTVSHTQTITVTDTTAPTLSSEPADVSVDCEAIPSVPTITATDNCDSVVDVVFTEVSNTVVDGCGEIVRQWESTDNCGNTVSHTQTITVTDTIAPVLSAAPADVSVDCEAIPAVPIITATDNCDTVVDVIFTEVSNTVVDGCGEIVRQWESTDNCGNTVNHTQTITVTDTTAPVLSAEPADVSVDCEAIPSVPTITATDNCDSVVDVVFTEVSNTVVDGCGEIVRQWESTDNCGNTVSHTQIITVADTTAPVLSATPADVSVDCEAIPAVPTITATDNCHSVVDVVFTEVSNTVVDGCGEIVRQWESTDNCGNTVSHTQTITVTDTTAPVLSATPADVSVDCEAIPAVPTITATDNCDSVVDVIFTEVSNTVVDGCGEIVRQWESTDNCGNTVSHTQTITVTDITNPDFTVPVDITIYKDDNCTYDASIGITGDVTDESDNCDTTLEASYSDVESAGTCEGEVIVTRTWSLTDNCGNTTEKVQTITVKDNTAPIIDETNKNNIDIECGVGDTETTLQDWLNSNAGATATDNCSTVTWTNNYGDDTSVKCDGSYITVTFTATDACGNFSTTTAGYLIKDETAPTITQQPSDKIVECDGAGNIAELNNWLATNGGATATDNCSIVTWSNNYTALTYTCSFTGEVEVVFTAKDACGNTVNTTSAKFTIEDTVAPEFVETLPAAEITVSCDNIPVMETLTATDNCDASVTVIPSEVTSGDDDACGSEYLITRKWTVSDCSGNTTTHIQVITVEDTTAPEFVEILPAAEITVSCDNIPVMETLTATDNCDASVAVIPSEVTSGDDDACGSEYLITRKWTVSDCSGNTTTHIQVITVEDTVAPEFVETLPAAEITVSCDNIPVMETLTATDNCDASVTVIPSEVTSGDDDVCGSEYLITRKWTVSDCSGNTTTHIQVITVEDTVAPEFVETLPAAEITVSCDNIPVMETLTATDNCDASVAVIPSEVTSGDDDACGSEYLITRKWTVSDCSGNTTTHIQVITVEDTVAPEFVETLPAAEITVSCDNIPVMETLTATDNCDASVAVIPSEVTSGDDDACGSEYLITRKWTVSDCSGNTTTHIQVITVEDTVAPEFVETLPAAEITVSCDNIPVMETLTATDNCDASVTVNYTEEFSGQDDACASEYTITRTWTVEDCAGNETSHTQVVTVEDTQAPEFVEELPADVTVSCDTIPAAAVLTATDNCDTSVTVNYSEEFSGQDDACASEYTVTRRWTVEDCAGNEASHTQVITIEDNEAPQLVSTLEDIIVECDTVPDVPTLEFIDNCSSNVTQTNFEETSTFDGSDSDYTITRTWTVTDDCGNVADFIQYITVTVKTSVTEIADSRCIDDGEINLNDYLGNQSENGTWEVTQGSVTISNDGSFDPSGVNLGDYVFTYTSSNSSCLTVTEVTININDDCLVLPCGQEDVVISKAVTPNGDSWNEFFEVTGAESCGFIANVKIFNRWGARVFESKNYANNWNGTSDGATFGSAERLPAGTYYYIVILENSGLKPFTGAIYLGTK